MKNASVVLPCYNGAQWIAEAIESVLAQTFEDFELVIIDDGSTDNSKEIVASHLRDERIRYIHQENRGFSTAINRGIKESGGNLVGFIGHDDSWMPNKLELQVKHFSEHKDVDLVHTNYCSIDSQGRIIGVRDIRIPDDSSKKEIVEQLFLSNFIGFETVLVRRKCFDEIGFFDERMMGFSDHDMWLRIAGRFNIAYIDLPLVRKREHSSQLTKAETRQGLGDEFLLLNKAIHEYPFLRKAERKKLGSLYYALGMVMLQKRSNEEAKLNFLKAFRCRPWELKAVIAYIAPTLYRFVWDRYQQSNSYFHRGMRWV